MFRFDTQPDTIVREVLDALCDDDVEPTEERQNMFAEFMGKASIDLVEKFGNDLREKIRNTVFGDTVTPEVVPMIDLRCIAIDIADVPDDEDKILVIGREIPQHEMDQESKYSIESRPVSEELIEMRNETGKSYDELVQEKKDEGDISYRYITSVEESKGLYECHIDLFADFSFIMPEPK